MDITFEIGDSLQPKGHALAYFRVDTEPDKIYATYIVILPVKADLGKYVPPFLASHLGNLPLSDFSAFAMPPVPEPMDGYQELERLSRLRADDLVYATSMFSFDLPRMMEAVSEVVQNYAQLCAEYFQAAPAPELETPRQEASDSSYQVNEVLFGLMSEGDKLAELSRLLGKLRFAQEGRDSGMGNEATDEITTLARHLPDNFLIASLLDAAKDPSQKGSELAQLYLDRCFRLSAGDAGSVQDLEQKIEALKSEN